VNLLGHNVYFDIDFLRATMKEENLPWIFHYHPICTMLWMTLWALAHGEKIRNATLKASCKRFNIPLENAHNALADIKATSTLAQKILGDLKFKIKGFKNA